MLQQLELIFLNFAHWFYHQPATLGLVTLGFIGAALVAMQWLGKAKTYTPGIIGSALLLAEFMHLLDPQRAINIIESAMTAMQSHPVKPLPFGLEYLFSTFVAPASHRFIHEEMIFIALILYIFFVLRISLDEYKKNRCPVW